MKYVKDGNHKNEASAAVKHEIPVNTAAPSLNSTSQNKDIHPDNKFRLSIKPHDIFNSIILAEVLSKPKSMRKGR